MYKCECCGEIFDNPVVKIERNTIEGYVEKLKTITCPYCESPYYREYYPYEEKEYFSYEEGDDK